MLATIRRMIAALIAALVLSAAFVSPATASATGVATLPAGHWSKPVTTGLCSGAYQMSRQEKADMSTMAWAHHPKQFTSVLCSGWKGPMDFAVMDVSAARTIGGWNEEDPDQYNIADVIAMINRYWLALNPKGTLIISGFHEANGFWAPYGECRNAGSAPCQLTVARWVSLLGAQSRAIKAGLSRRVVVKFDLAINYTTKALVGGRLLPGKAHPTHVVGGTVYDTNPDAWIRAAKAAKIPFDYIGLSMYQNDTRTSWKAFKASQVTDEVRCLKARIAIKTCQIKAPLGPDSWVKAAKAYGKPLLWREWGGKRGAWMTGAVAYLRAAVKAHVLVGEAHLYDASRNACHYAQKVCYYDLKH